MRVCKSNHWIGAQARIVERCISFFNSQQGFYISMLCPEQSNYVPINKKKILDK